MGVVLQKDSQASGAASCLVSEQLEQLLVQLKLFWVDVLLQNA